MTVLRMFVVAAWIAIVWFTSIAVSTAGASAGAKYFPAEYADPWGAQVMTDTGIHLALLALWIIWREDNKVIGLVCGFAALIMGAFFSMPYLLVATIRSKGDVVRMLVGQRSTAREQLAAGETSSY